VSSHLGGDPGSVFTVLAAALLATCKLRLTCLQCCATTATNIVTALLCAPVVLSTRAWDKDQDCVAFWKWVYNGLGQGQ
jgi:hypothetical protein